MIAKAMGPHDLATTHPLGHFLTEVGNDFVPASIQGYTHRLRQQARSFGRSPEVARDRGCARGDRKFAATSTLRCYVDSFLARADQLHG